MHITVVIPTVGRPAIVRRGIDRLREQTRKPDRIIVVATTPDDVEASSSGEDVAEVHFTSKGSCKQRNVGLRLSSSQSDVILFIDDDFVMAADYLETMEACFDANPSCAGLTGAVLADGAHRDEISELHAGELLQRPAAVSASAMIPKETLYGCNMAYRISMLSGMEFDENLPLYAWQEDIDFSYRLAKNHPLFKNPLMRGVHLGTRSGRSSGRRVGYSQIANPIYLLRKKGIPPAMARRLMLRNLMANVIGSFKTNPAIDRRGRLQGNALAILDLAKGKVRPDRIVDL